MCKPTRNGTARKTSKGYVNFSSTPLNYRENYFNKAYAKSKFNFRTARFKSKCPIDVLKSNATNLSMNKVKMTQISML